MTQMVTGIASHGRRRGKTIHLSYWFAGLGFQKQKYKAWPWLKLIVQ